MGICKNKLYSLEKERINAVMNNNNVLKNHLTTQINELIPNKKEFYEK
jgi:hypothetical protein